MSDLFERCRAIAIKIDEGNELKAREDLIRLLNDCQKESIAYTPFLNHLIRQLGLFPYMKDNAIWQDRVVLNFFEADVGEDKPGVLHIDQSDILRKLQEGQSLLVSAPTSFGKSFIVDAYIATKKPKNIVIIVPTIALTDETRRRLHSKFGKIYNIISQQDEDIKDYNIFIFPQERAFSYLGKLVEIDILIVDEFYKASHLLGDERYVSLVKIIVELKKIAKQCYFIAPDFTSDPNLYPLIKGMHPFQTNKMTVYTDIHEDYQKITKKCNKSKWKEKRLVELLSKREKTLIFAGDPKEIQKVSNILKRDLKKIDSDILTEFSSYLCVQYGENNTLSDLVSRGIGIHNGRLHRPIGQLQIKLFSEENGLNAIISSSSIIEGVNTSAENVILWSNKIANKIMTSYSYNNIIGRAGRMFKYFIGRVFLLENPPDMLKPQPLPLDYSDEVIETIEEVDRERELTKEQIAKLKSSEEAFDKNWGKGLYRKLKSSVQKQVFNVDLITKILVDLKEKPEIWNDDNLKRFLHKNVGEWSFRITTNVSALAQLRDYNKKQTHKILQVLSHNWDLPSLDIIQKMPPKLKSIEKYFKIERDLSFKFTSVFALCVNVYNCFHHKNIDISPCISRISNLFLPKLVYQLEEYGLPRSLSKKIVKAGIIELDNPNMTLSDAIKHFKEIGKNKLIAEISDKHPFEDYILEYFYSGI